MFISKYIMVSFSMKNTSVNYYDLKKKSNIYKFRTLYY